MKAAIGVDEAEVAGAEIAISRRLGPGERSGIALGAGAAITRCHIARDFEEPGLASRQFAPVLRIDDTQPDARELRPLPLHAPRQRPVVRRHAAIAVDFGGAVDVADLRRAELFGGDALADVEAVLDDREVLQPHRFRPGARSRRVEDQRIVARAGAIAARLWTERSAGAESVVSDPARPELVAQHDDEAQARRLRRQ